MKYGIPSPLERMIPGYYGYYGVLFLGSAKRVTVAVALTGAQ